MFNSDVFKWNEYTCEEGICAKIVSATCQDGSTRKRKEFTLQKQILPFFNQTATSGANSFLSDWTLFLRSQFFPFRIDLFPEAAPFIRRPKGDYESCLLSKIGRLIPGVYIPLFVKVLKTPFLALLLFLCTFYYQDSD